MVSANPIRRMYEARFRKWPKTQATVESCSWVSGHDNLGCDSGHYDVSYAYRAGTSGEVQRGSFCYEDGCKEVAPYSKGEALTVQFDPKSPGHSKIPGADSNYEKIEALVVMGLFGLLAGYVLTMY